jgi:tRNA A37 threonylcarbamoyladenosine dehydratase
MMENEQYVPASNAYVPAAAGLLIASQVIHDLLHPTTD